MAQSNDVKRVPVISAAQSIGKEMFSLSIPHGELQLACVTGEALKIDIRNLTPEILTQAVLHGLKQKLVDAAAISRNPDTGRSATPEDKWAAVVEVAARVTGPNGQWNATRGEGGTGTGGLLFRALCRAYPARTPESLREYLAGKSKAEHAALRANPKIAAIIEEIKAEDERAPADTATSDALLAELEGDEQ